MRVRNLSVLLLALFAGQTYAATTVATVWIDTDADPQTGCAVAGGISGVERALVTTVDATTSLVTSVQRRECAGGVFGSLVSIGGPWPAAHTATATQAETRIALADLPQERRGAAMRLAFSFETAGGTVAFTTMPDGSPIYYPALRPRRRRAARPADGTQALVADGNIADWARLQPLFERGLHAVWVHGTPAELFFRFDLRTTSEAPVAANDAYAVRQGKSLVVDAPGVLENDTDADGDDLSAKLVAPAAHGTLTLSPDGSFVYNNNGVLGGDGFDYKASDGAADSNAARVTINVTPNSVPVAQNDTFTTAKGGTLVIAAPGVLANDSDADGDPLTASVTAPPAQGALTLAPDGSLTYIHNGSTEPSDTFSYTVSDGLASSTPGSVTINVSTTNAPPVAVDDVFHVANGGTLDVAAPGLFTNDLDSDTSQSQWTTTVVAGPTHGVLTAGTGGAFIYVHDGSGASDSFTYRVSDGTSFSNIATVTIVAGAVNAAPVANADNYAVDEDATLTIAAAGVLANDTDAEGSALSVVAGNLPSHGALTLNANGSFTYLPQGNYFGTDSFTYAATDGTLTSAFTTVTIQIDAVNDPPVNVSDAYTVAEGGTLTVPAPGLLANDSDLDNATLTAFSTATNATVNADGSFTYVHDGSETFADSFTYETRDGAAATSGIAVITITEVNDVPFADADTKTVAEDTPLTFAIADLLANDSAGDGETSQTLAFVATSNAQHGIVSANGGNITFTPDPNFAGTASFRYTITDDGTTNGASDPQTATAIVTVNVTTANDAPVATPDALTTNEDETLNIAAATLTGNDNAGPGEAAQTIAITAVSNAVNGVVSLNSGVVTFIPTPGFSGTATFTYTITDSGGTNGVADPLTADATVTITVAEVNDAPMAAADAKITAEDTPLTFAATDLTANDSAGALEPSQTITVTSVGNAVNGTVSLVNGTITFTPAAHVAGAASFSYTITDNGTPAMTATSTVAVRTTRSRPAKTRR
jgi:VCBS repeat-containing protein